MSKLLLVEDDNNLREIYEARLQAEGYEIVTAKDGEEALAVAKAERPDLIISDVMMPKISGFEMLDILKNTDGLKNVKVIMLTALGQSDDQQRADSLGADKYLIKSQVTLEDIVRVAHELLEDGVSEAPATAAPQPSPAPVSVAPAAPAPTIAPPVATPAPEPTASVVASPADLSPVSEPVATPPAPVTAAPEPTIAPPVVATPAPEPTVSVVASPANLSPVSEPVATAPATAASQPSPEPVSVAPAAPEPTIAPPVVATPAPEPTANSATGSQVAASSDQAMPAAEESAKLQDQIENLIEGASTEAPTPAEEAASSGSPSVSDQPETNAAPQNDSVAVNDQIMNEAVNALATGEDTKNSPTTPEPSPVAAPVSAEPATTPTSPSPVLANDSKPQSGTMSHEKVIMPPADSHLDEKPDIQSLLAAEQAKEALQQAQPMPAATNGVPQTATTPDQPFDPNSIAL